ncbi:eukaryotic translation initiation factor 4 gamma-like [Lathyrus oleraceus]|uniref:eukaryotic translation initiation factor 4 gamma-like n=1 Tax=Pisum sativum TaxID=3888 RepID=UPI0021D11CEA|nr:eukaryotic translation initiation factor 4 gamma-like [Pisum sativum]
MAQLQAHALASQQPSHSEPELTVTTPPAAQNPTTSEPPAQQPTHSPSEPNPQPKQTTPSSPAIPTPTTSAASVTPTLNLSAPNSPSPSSLASATEPETTFPTLEEAVLVFAESSVEKVKSLTINSEINDDPSEVRIYWSRVISWMTSKAFKLKGLSKQVHDDFIRDAGIRLQERLAREAEEQARKEAKEKARQEEEQRIREAEEKVASDVAAATTAAEAEAKVIVEVEEVARIATKEAAKARTNTLTQGEHSNSGFVPLVLKTLEEL